MYTASPQCFLGWRQVAPKMRYALEAAPPQCRAPLHTMHPSRGDRRRLPKKDALSTLGAIPVHELLVTPAIAAVLEGGKGEVRDRHGGNRGDDHEHRGQDVESGHDGHHPFRYKSSARHTMRTIFRSLRATGGARIACRGPHALRCEPKTGRRTRGARATHRKPDTAQGARAPRAPVRAPNKRACSPRAAIHAPHEGHTCRVPRPARMQGTRARDPRRSGARALRPARRAGANAPYRAYCGFSIADCAAPSTKLRKPQSDGEQMCAPARELAPCRRVQWFGTYPSRLREHHDR